jgi:hypothetical protein
MLVYDVEAIKEPKVPIPSSIWFERFHETERIGTKLGVFYSLTASHFEFRPFIPDDKIRFMPPAPRRNSTGNVVKSRAEVIERITSQHKDIFADFPTSPLIVSGLNIALP